jgi:methionyl-tRNA formyltransferase
MKTVVFAYHDMGLAGLKALLRADYDIQCIISHEDDPKENCWFGSVRKWAEEQKIPVHCPANVNRPDWISRIAALRPEMIFSFYYRHMLNEDLLQIPARGAYNLHGSLLPTYRGRCPVNWVLVRGETRTGVTLHHMVAKADAGDIVGQRAVPIQRTDTALTLYHQMCVAAAELMDELLPLLNAGTAPRIPQDLSLGSYFGGRTPRDGRIDWRWSAETVYNLVRAVTEPYPGAFCSLPDGSELLIWWAVPEEKGVTAGIATPGKIRIEGDAVLLETGRGVIRLLDVEIRSKRIRGEALIQYFKRREGQVLS